MGEKLPIFWEQITSRFYKEKANYMWKEPEVGTCRGNFDWEKVRRL